MMAVDEYLALITGCRSCTGTNLQSVLSLGETPLANSLLDSEEAAGQIRRFPLDLVRCLECHLVQLRQVVSPEHLFSDYIYFSSFSDAMVAHARELALDLIAREALGPESLVCEIASNDGYLLQHFQREGVPVLGIEPAKNIAEFAVQRQKIPTLNAFFTDELAEHMVANGQLADVVIGNNVLAHVPDLNGFVRGVSRIVKPTGVAVFEVPYLRDMIDRVEFDTIYHEHQCYFSLAALHRLFSGNALTLCDVEQLPIHGGSLRVTVCPEGARPATERLREALAAEASWGVHSAEPYTTFAQQVDVVRAALRALLKEVKQSSAHIAAYGASAKGVTLLSYCGTGAEYLDFVVDRSTYKQGKRYPVDGMPIYPPEALRDRAPEYTLLLTWNFADEIMAQQREYLSRGGKFIIPVPEPRVVSGD